MATPESDNEKPPVFKQWSGWYWLMLGITLTQFIIYFFITTKYK